MFHGSVNIQLTPTKSIQFLQNGTLNYLQSTA